jgi:hypothetical protein
MSGRPYLLREGVGLLRAALEELVDGPRRVPALVVGEERPAPGAYTRSLLSSN